MSSYALGRIDYNKLPSYLRNDYDADGLNITGQKPYATLWGQQLGLDNNYNYGVMPDGSVQQLFYGQDPYWDPNSSAGGNDPSIKTAQQLAEEYGWDYANAPRDAHGYAMPGDLGGLRYGPYTNPGQHDNWFFDKFGPMAAFTLMTMGVGSAAAAGAGLTGSSASALSSGVSGGMSSGAAGGNPLVGAATGALGGSSGSVLGGTETTSAAGGTAGGSTAAASGGAGMWDWLDDIGLDEYGNSTGSFQGGSGDYFDPMNGGGGSRMPPAVPEADPTFGGTLTQTGPGQYEDLKDLGGLDLPGSNSPWWDRLSNGAKSILAGRSAAAGGTAGGNGRGGIGDMSWGDMAFDSTPFLLSAYLANKQRNDINPYLARINALSDRFAGNEPAYLKSLTDPYDMATAQQGGALRTSLGNRGVMGSSFGDMGLDNFNYMRDVGRGNLLARGINEGVGAQSQLTDQAMKAINTRNAGTNALLGAGLNASARLFSPQTDQFGLRELYRMMGGG